MATRSGNMCFNLRNPLARILLFAILLVALFLFTFRKPTVGRARIVSNQIEHLVMPSFTDCSINSTFLQSLRKKYQLQDEIEYAQRYININRKKVDRKSITKINDKLFPEAFDMLNLTSSHFNSTCLKPLEVTVPKSPSPKTVNASDLLFGISTTYRRLYDERISTINEWAHWLTDGQGKSNGGGLILRLVDASVDQLEETQRKLTGMGMDVQVHHSNSSQEMAQRYLSLLPALYEDSSRRDRKWLVMCDDDTFFPSMHSLLAKLLTFDRNASMYIGTLSEDINNIQRHGSQAFGGAGVFFSLPLASTVSKLYNECSTPQKLQESNSGWGPQGDILLRKCIYENTEVRLTMMPELHQLDIQGDPSGFYESGLAPISLHHFKGGAWHSAEPYEGAKIVHLCGEDCFLQRFLTKDDFIISNGYSIAHYPHGISFDVNQMERTFHSAPDDYGYNLDFMLGGPGRQSLVETGRKVAWELKASLIQDDGSVRQSYIRKADDRRWADHGKAMFEKDGILELIWVP